MEGYTVEEFTKAKAARDALAMMAHPQDKKMKHLVSSQNVTHMPFTSTNFANGRALFGPDRGAIRGKTVRQLPSSGVSDEFLPREIVSGLRLDFSKHCRSRFGSYVEANQDSDITNTLNDRTAPCILLGPTGNVQGSVNCYNLETKKVVVRRTMHPLPIPDHVIRRVIKLGQRFGEKGPDEEENTDLIEPEPSSDTDVLPAEIPGVELEEPAPAGPTKLQVAATALANANLRTTDASECEIAGVDVIEDEDHKWSRTTKRATLSFCPWW
eukprot:scaffold1710_cov37-Cyclotella_meneghiniana.AAC.2